MKQTNIKEVELKGKIIKLFRNTNSMFKFSQNVENPSQNQFLYNIKSRDEYSHLENYEEDEDEVEIKEVKSNDGIMMPPKKHKKNPKKRKRDDSKSLLLYEKEEFDSMSTYDKSLILLEKRRRLEREKKPEWHAPWKLFRVLSGHLGWVRAIAVDVTNEWFATGASDRQIKIWDLARGKLKLTLTGHINTIRAIVIGEKIPYLFSVGEDKMIKCWDLETNKNIKSYHGHLSGVYCADLHPSLNVLVTGGRDCSARVWDIRTKAEVFLLTGHDGTVSSLKCQSAEPQIITGSSDNTVRLWDLRTGKAKVILTNHKKSVRSVLIHPVEYSFASAAADGIKKWACPKGRFLQNLKYASGDSGNLIVNTLAINQDNVLFSGSHEGDLMFWDWKTGHMFQRIKTIPQSGSLEAEKGILCSTFDKSGSRLLTGEIDKTIKIWKEDTTATPKTHPVEYKYEQTSFF